MDDKVYYISAKGKRELFEKISDCVYQSIIEDPSRYTIKVAIDWSDLWSVLCNYFEEFGKLYGYDINVEFGGNLFTIDWTKDMTPIRKRNRKGQ